MLRGVSLLRGGWLLNNVWCVCNEGSNLKTQVVHHHSGLGCGGVFVVYVELRYIYIGIYTSMECLLCTNSSVKNISCTPKKYLGLNNTHTIL